jgi:hypothetical protein
MFIYIDIADENQAKPFLTLFGIEDSENTVVSFLANNYCFLQVPAVVSLFFFLLKL